MEELIESIFGTNVGEKLPIVFVLKAKRGGEIEASELSTYPPDHMYCVQGNGWMDSVVWNQYITDFLPYIFLDDGSD